MQPLAFFIFAEKYRCENGWSTTARFISFPLQAFWSMILWRKRPERKDKVHESRLECTRSPRPVDRGRPQCPVSYPDNNSASHLLNLYGLRTDELFELLHLILDNNIFEYANTPFKQIRGLAMGNRLSGTLAILTMDRFECKYIYPVIKPTIYVRYVDDIGTTVQTIEEAHETLHMMNSKHPTLRFELEAPDAAGFLPILDVKIKINVDGSMERKLYTKPANKGITLNYRSHHPSSTKLAVTTNEFDRTLRCSSEEHVEDAVQTTRKKLTANGYPAHVLDRSYARVTKRGKEERRRMMEKWRKRPLPWLWKFHSSRTR